MAFLNLFAPGFRLMDGQTFNNIFNGITTVPQMLITTIQGTFTGSVAQPTTASFKIAPQIVTAAGATQGTATLITAAKAIITVALTASTKGVKLPVAATGLEVEVGNLATFGVKVYPNTNGKIGAASTNAADTVLAINKANRYLALNTTLWCVQRGA